MSSVLTRVNRFDIDPRIRSTAAAYPDPALRSMLAAVALRRSYVAGCPTVDTMDAAEHLRSALHVYTTRAAPALGIDAYAQQVYEANLETLTSPLSAGDDHDNP